MISSFILKKLKLAAESYLNQPVSKAVITVPAFFNESQREATVHAAEMAGLEVVRLLNEPTAAAIAYSIGKKDQENCLVYDLGGGTFDVSIVNISKDVMEVKASHGDVELGGSDFDNLIANKARQAFLQDNKIDLALIPTAWARILRAAEAAKIRLSTEGSADLLEEFIADNGGVPLHLNFRITRTEFESMIKPAIERTLLSIRKAIEMSSLTNSQIHRVILVGGATYTPLVAECIEKEMKITPQTWLDPSTIVAMGAAIEAANLSGQKIGPVMVDVTPHSLGTGCLDEYDNLKNIILIRRNTPIPCTSSKIFYKCVYGQLKIEVTAYQGESEEISQNKCLGKFVLNDLGESDGQDICIKFHLDRSGILHVTATDVSTGKNMNQVLKKIAESRKKNVDLSLLESIKIETQPKQDHLFGEDQDFWDSLDLDPLDTQSKIENHIEHFQENDGLYKRAHALIDKGALAELDFVELTSDLQDAKNGDLEALLRLRDLVYFLE